MSVRERLRNLSKLDRLIDCKIKQFEINKRLLSDEIYSVKCKQFSDEINADIDRLIDEKADLMKLIDNTPELSAVEISILYKHYLEGKTYGQIAKEIFYSKTSTYRMCVNAIEKIEVRLA